MNLLLYFITSLIWGSTWLAIQYQLGVVAPVWSVTYRFAFASVLLLAYCVVKKLPLRFNRTQHGLLAMQGLLLFSANYVLFYTGSTYFISGIVAVLYASMIIFNIINSRIIFGNPIALRILLGASLGLMGLASIVLGEIGHMPTINPTHALQGVAVCLLAALLASFGNCVSAALQRQELPILTSNTIGMTYGTFFLLCFALLSGQAPHFSWQFSYLASLVYLTFIGTIVAFGTYLKLLNNIGVERAAYAFILIPVIAMVFSSLFEDFQWHISTVLGTIGILIGNYLVLSKKPTMKIKNIINQPYLGNTEPV